MSTVLLADDDASIRTVLSRAFEKHGHHVHATGAGDQLMRWVGEGLGDVVITDVIMPTGGFGESGIDLLSRIKRMRPALPVIVISAQSTLMTAVKANAAGAYEYLAKPFDLNEIIACVENAAQQTQAKPAMPGGAEASLAHHSIIGTSQAMQQIFRTLARMVSVDLTVLIHGESGTGKELVARALHDLGARKHNPFVPMNMAAIPRELVESELFGHEKGAFTGALARKSGTFEQAASGTVFLDEIGDMPMEAQTKLLRVLQQGEFTSVGGTRPIQTDVRVICATHRDLTELVKTGSFREDLYYRLNVVPITVPPLRSRVEDIPQLATHFLQKAETRGLPPKILSRDAMVELQGYSWPGNVRELENLIYRLCALTAEHVADAKAVRSHLQTGEGSDVLHAGSLESAILEHLRRYFAAHEGSLPPQGLYERVLALVERPLIQETLKATAGNQLKAASVLGINRNTLRKRMRELGICVNGAG